jgi:prepilin-type N-terminal cleavage/methylation domain-containing protein
MYKRPNNPQSSKGFTLLEILLVVAAIAILAGIVIFAINPGKQLAELRNGKRRADVSLIVNALYQYVIDNNGVGLNTIIPERDVIDCAAQTDAEISLCTGGGCGMNLSVLTDNQKYLVSLPVDPSGGVASVDYSGYFVWVSTNNRVTACAPKAELGASISVTR